MNQLIGALATSDFKSIRALNQIRRGSQLTTSVSNCRHVLGVGGMRTIHPKWPG